ncbi:sorting and assembly machinery component 50 homolog B-like protein [Tanacetum coccineum]
MAPKDPHFTQPESEPEPEDDDDDDDDDDDESEYEYEEEEETEEEEEDKPVTAHMEALIQRVKSERVPLRVHDVIIKGNTKTKDSVIEFQIQALKTVTSVQELLQAAQIARARLRKLDIFDSVSVTLDAGPPGRKEIKLNPITRCHAHNRKILLRARDEALRVPCINRPTAISI